MRQCAAFIFAAFACAGAPEVVPPPGMTEQVASEVVPLLPLLDSIGLAALLAKDRPADGDALAAQFSSFVAGCPGASVTHASGSETAVLSLSACSFFGLGPIDGTVEARSFLDPRYSPRSVSMDLDVRVAGRQQRISLEATLYPTRLVWQGRFDDPASPAGVSNIAQGGFVDLDPDQGGVVATLELYRQPLPGEGFIGCVSQTIFQELHHRFRSCFASGGAVVRCVTFESRGKTIYRGAQLSFFESTPISGDVVLDLEAWSDLKGSAAFHLPATSGCPGH